MPVAADLYWDWIDREAHDAHTEHDTGGADFSFADAGTMLYPADAQGDNRRSSRALAISEDASPPESPARSTAKGPARKDAEKRREQNRAAQRAYRDRQKVLVDGLLAEVQELHLKMKQQSTKCELLESMCKRLATENDVYREFLKLGRN
ncbi:hypothetical protein LTR53_011814 [Teratosphaeriaceae sp. CCFEE 6253]|nr:hypothetical protein LTR53_011814 [Teratosphaeriaceae sp. CCFEE 6253]